MQKIKLGIIGLGNMGTTHVKSIQAGMAPEIELGAVADRLPSRREWAAGYLPSGFPVFGDGLELINSKF